MRWWPFGRRRDGGRHSFGAAITSLPTGPLRLAEPEPLPEIVVPWEAAALDTSSHWSATCSDADVDADDDLGPSTLSALLGQSDDGWSDDVMSDDGLSDGSPFDLDLDLDRDLPPAASPALTVVPGAPWAGPDLGRPLELTPLHACWPAPEEPLGPPAEAGLLSLPVVTLEPRRNEEPHAEESVPFGYALAEESVPFGYDGGDLSLPVGHELGEERPIPFGGDVSVPFGYALEEDLSLPVGYALPAETLAVPFDDELREDLPVLPSAGPADDLAPLPVPLLALDAAYPLPGPALDVPVLDVPVEHAADPVLDVPVAHVPVHVPQEQEPGVAPPLPVPAPDTTDPAELRRGLVGQGLPPAQEQVADDLQFPVVVAPPFVPAGPPLAGLLPEPRGDQHDHSGARVQLGFRDGSSVVLPPGCEPSRALHELARILLARH